MAVDDMVAVGRQHAACKSTSAGADGAHRSRDCPRYLIERGGSIDRVVHQILSTGVETHGVAYSLRFISMHAFNITYRVPGLARSVLGHCVVSRTRLVAGLGWRAQEPGVPRMARRLRTTWWPSRQSRTSAHIRYYYVAS